VSRPALRAIIFDLDGTLYDERGGMQRALDTTLGEASRRLPEFDPERARALYPEVGREIWERANLLGPANPQGATTEDLRRQVWRGVLGALGHDGIRYDGGSLADHLAGTYTAARRAGHRLFEDSAPALARLEQWARPGGLERIAMITNGPSDLQREKLSACGLEGRFDPLIISAEAGRAKPDPGIFLDAVSACGFDPAEVLYVGDNPALDIGGAKSAGLAAAWVRRLGEAFPGDLPAPDYTIEDLHPLAELDWGGR